MNKTRFLVKQFAGDFIKPLKHGYGYLVECPCVGHADTHRIRISYVSDTPRSVLLTKQ